MLLTSGNLACLSPAHRQDVLELLHDNKWEVHQPSCSGHGASMLHHARPTAKRSRSSQPQAPTAMWIVFQEPILRSSARIGFRLACSCRKAWAPSSSYPTEGQSGTSNADREAAESQTKARCRCGLPCTLNVAASATLNCPNGSRCDRAGTWPCCLFSADCSNLDSSWLHRWSSWRRCVKKKKRSRLDLETTLGARLLQPHADATELLASC